MHDAYNILNKRINCSFHIFSDDWNWQRTIRYVSVVPIICVEKQCRNYPTVDGNNRKRTVGIRWRSISKNPVAVTRGCICDKSMTKRFTWMSPISLMECRSTWILFTRQYLRLNVDVLALKLTQLPRQLVHLCSNGNSVYSNNYCTRILACACNIGIEKCYLYSYPVADGRGKENVGEVDAKGSDVNAEWGVVSLLHVADDVEREADKKGEESDHVEEQDWQ